MIPQDILNGIKTKYDRRGRHVGYHVWIANDYLGVEKHLSAYEYDLLLQKIHRQLEIWRDRVNRDAGGKSASRKTNQARRKIDEVKNLLADALTNDPTIDWDTVLSNIVSSDEDYHSNCPKYITLDSDGFPKKYKKIKRAPSPDKTDFFKPVDFLNRVFRDKEKIEAEQKSAYEQAVKSASAENKKIDRKNQSRSEVFEEMRAQWHSKKYEVTNMQNQYEDHDASMVAKYCLMVLDESLYPKGFPSEFEMQYNSVNGFLIVEYQLPSIDDMPSIKEVRYVKSRNEFDEKMISQTERAKLYDNAIYQIMLRIIYELFTADYANALQVVSINGMVMATSPATGQMETTCITSLQAEKEEFQQINLAGIVDGESYRECFKALKGVGSSKLSAMAAVRPIIEFDKSDKRFIDHADIASDLDEDVNIAAMDWAEFEHLVREIFEKEFSEGGGEVKVTQSSADGGVDAIAFDPDPIKGGKIVIQAKRYTNIVGVAAVRDLYGTVVNEGATKGILVTTSDYGPDSYKFAKDKPITLLNGANLLHLLEKHGHKAKIDIKEAKKILKENS